MGSRPVPASPPWAVAAAEMEAGVEAEFEA